MVVAGPGDDAAYYIGGGGGLSLTRLGAGFTDDLPEGVGVQAPQQAQRGVLDSRVGSGGHAGRPAGNGPDGAARQTAHQIGQKQGHRHEHAGHQTGELPTRGHALIASPDRRVPGHVGADQDGERGSDDRPGTEIAQAGHAGQAERHVQRAQHHQQGHASQQASENARSYGFRPFP